LYGSAVCAILYAGERKGPVRLVFEKLYDIQVYVSEKFQDPASDNATWAFERPKKILYLQPSEIKPLTKKPG
jgi:hypothetical protein